MKKYSYTEFVRDDSTLSFLSKSHRFFEKHVGVKLSRVGKFFRDLKANIKDRFSEREDIYEDAFNVRQPLVNIAKIVNNKEEVDNKEQQFDILFKDTVELAKSIDKNIKDNNSEEKKELVDIIYKLKDAKDEKDYSKLAMINNKLKVLKNKIIDSKFAVRTKTAPKEVPKIEATVVLPKIEEKVETKVEEPKVEIKEEPKVETKEEPKVETKEEPKVETKTEPAKKPADYKRMYLGNSKKLSKKITELESVVKSDKDDIKYYERKIQGVDEIISTENLDSREIKLYEEVKSDYKTKLDAAKAKLVESEKAVKDAQVELSLYMQEEVDYYIDGKVYKKVSRREALKYLEDDRKLELTIKKNKEKEKLEKEIAALKAKLAEKEAKLNTKEEEISDLRGYGSCAHTEYTPEEYHELVVNMHKKSFY